MTEHLGFLALFPLGVLIGLLIGPAKERLDAAYTNGFISGMKAANRKEKHDAPEI